MDLGIGEIIFGTMMCLIFFVPYFGFLMFLCFKVKIPLFSMKDAVLKYIVSYLIITIATLLLFYHAGLNLQEAVEPWAFTFIIPAYLLTFGLTVYIFSGCDKDDAVICPKCGRWNDYRKKDLLNTSLGSAWVNVEREIRNNKGEVIGSYDAGKERHYYVTEEYMLECKKCRNNFTVNITQW